MWLGDVVFLEPWNPDLAVIHGECPELPSTALILRTDQDGDVDRQSRLALASPSSA